MNHKCISVKIHTQIFTFMFTIDPPAIKHLLVFILCYFFAVISLLNVETRVYKGTDKKTLCWRMIREELVSEMLYWWRLHRLGSFALAANRTRLNNNIACFLIKKKLEIFKTKLLFKRFKTVFKVLEEYLFLNIPMFDT